MRQGALSELCEIFPFLVSHDATGGWGAFGCPSEPQFHSIFHSVAAHIDPSPSLLIDCTNVYTSLHLLDHYETQVAHGKLTKAHRTVATQFPSLLVMEHDDMQAWTSYEDDRLREALILNKKGTKNWREVAAHVGTKTAHQCQQRWKNTLNPDVLRIKGRWTTEVRCSRSHHHQLIPIQRREQLGTVCLCVG